MEKPDILGCGHLAGQHGERVAMFYVGLIVILLFVIVIGMSKGAKQREKHNEDVLRSLGNLQATKNPGNVGGNTDPKFQFTKSHCGQKLMAAARKCPKSGVSL